MPGQIVAPIPVSPQHRSLPLCSGAAPDLFASLSATVTASSSHGGKLCGTDTPYYIPENDYTVPAPPPPSPVGFRNDHWSPVSAVNKTGVTPVCR